MISVAFFSVAPVESHHTHFNQQNTWIFVCFDFCISDRVFNPF